MKSNIKRWVLVLLCLVSSGLQAQEGFPGRVKYPQVPYIELLTFYQERDKAVIIDARSPYEFQTLRIKNSVNVPLILPPKKFRAEITALQDANPGKKLVFYCNGHRCMKSYKAARRAIVYMGLKNIYAFDAGIFDWAQTYPDESLLLGRVLEDPADLISKADFREHILPAKKFIKSADSSVEILDIRDRIERDGFYIFSGEEKSISLNLKEKTKLDKFMKDIRKNDKTLYVYDMVGKQVRWFQYYIESEKIKKYYFMEGGADAFFNIPLSELVD
ncbi:hypothetical protein MNBD_GAMMA11-1773 [hydrothermal vent metagenome]|uniref:Rhodanese domain-containing protein n=1 Tax=hydrothermal vent metagenome TaxID=652676 RepID=A0A3B0XNN9_9ZZZZ